MAQPPAPYLQGASFYNAWETRSVFQGDEVTVFSTACLTLPVRQAGGRQAFSAARHGGQADFARKGGRRPIAQTAVRPLFVVLLPPRRDLLPGIEQVLEPTRVQTFVSQLAVETLDVRVLHRLARFDVHELNLPLQTPRQKMTAGELRPVAPREAAVFS